ncbi:50S ribosomal protein L6 [Patescibacteria group bacterium]
MSRIGKLPIELPEGVTAEISKGFITVKGPNGELKQEIRPEIKVEVKDGIIEASIGEKSKEAKAFWGMTRALIANMVGGVTKGYEKKLELVGVGYRVAKADEGITLSLGFSHPVEYSPPEGVKLEVVDNKNITIKGIDKQQVGLVAAKIRSFKKPEPYKGKGIKYIDEIVKRKPGKAGKI